MTEVAWLDSAAQKTCWLVFLLSAGCTLNETVDTIEDAAGGNRAAGATARGGGGASEPRGGMQPAGGTRPAAGAPSVGGTQPAGGSSTGGAGAAGAGGIGGLPPLDGDVDCKVVDDKCHSLDPTTRCCGLYGRRYRLEDNCQETSEQLIACHAYRLEELVVVVDREDAADCMVVSGYGAANTCATRPEANGEETWFWLAGYPGVGVWPTKLSYAVDHSRCLSSPYCP